MITLTVKKDVGSKKEKGKKKGNFLTIRKQKARQFSAMVGKRYVIFKKRGGALRYQRAVQSSPYSREKEHHPS